MTSFLERTYISHLWSTPVAFPFCRTYDLPRESSAACKAFKVLKTTVLKRLRSAILVSSRRWHGQCLPTLLESSRRVVSWTYRRISAVMQVGVARSAKGDQIFFAIVTGSAAEFLVVNLKIGHLSA